MMVILSICWKMIVFEIFLTSLYAELLDIYKYLNSFIIKHKSQDVFFKMSPLSYMYQVLGRY